MNTKREFLFLFLFQPQNGLSSPGSIMATNKLGKTDATEALDLSEKLVCTPSLSPPPVQTRNPLR